MKRLVVEVSPPPNEKAIPMLGFFEKVKSMETMMFLRQSVDDIALVFQVSFKSPGTKIDEFPAPEWMNMEVLDFDEGHTKYTVLARGTRTDKDQNIKDSRLPADYFVTKFSFSDGTYRIALISSPETIRTIIGGLERLHSKYKIISLTEARFRLSSPTDSLTGKQSKILTSAYQLGYYDIPRKINTRQLAEKAGVANSTLVAHLRKAEKRVMDEVLGGL